MHPLLRALLAGLAAGARSLSVVSALSRTPVATNRVERALQNRRVRGSLAPLAAAELVGDKLPVTPPRSQPPSSVFRVLLGALSGALVAQRGGNSAVAGTLLGAVGSAATTFGGPTYRRQAAARFGTDWPGALAEDAAALRLAVAVAH